MNDMVSPSVELSKISRSDRAQRIVLGMSENQQQYALWCALVLLFGSPDSNASDVVCGHPLPDYLPMAEAQTILAQIGCPRSRPEDVKRMVRVLKEMLDDGDGGG